MKVLKLNNSQPECAQ